MKEKKGTSPIKVVKFAGAFVAFIVGSGYASGQEIIQFFSSYGYWGIAGGLISLLLFAWSAAALMCYGFDKRADIATVNKHPFDHWFIFKDGGTLARLGKGVSVFFEYFIPAFLFAVVVIMVSGTGATMNQFFGLPVLVGCFIMSAAVFISVAFGLKRIIDIIGVIGPITTVFTIFIAVYAIATAPTSLAAAGQAMQTISMPTATKFWWLAGVLYVAYNVTGSVPFLTAMGAEGTSRREVRSGAVLGSIMLMGCAILLVVAHILYAPQIESLQVPNLYLAERLSPIASLIFTLCLIAEIFATAAPMLWTTCNKFTAEGSKANKLLALVLCVVAFFGGQLPFGTLVGLVYPYMGYIGIFFFVCILVKQLVGSRAEKTEGKK